MAGLVTFNIQLFHMIPTKDQVHYKLKAWSQKKRKQYTYSEEFAKEKEALKTPWNFCILEEKKLQNQLCSRRDLTAAAALNSSFLQ